MASSGVDPTTGAPLFPEEDAPQLGADLEEVADFAVFRGNMLKGTIAEMNGFAYPIDGMVWSSTTDGAIYRYNGSEWVFVWAQLPWVNLTLSTGWTAVSGHTPRARVIGDVCYIEGAVSRGIGGAMASIATAPAGYRPAKTTFYGATTAVNGASIASAELTMDTTGLILIGVYTDISAASGWTVPISGSFVL